MIKKVTKNNYRKYYKEYYNIEFGIDMEVHHIDFNRDNNDIENLLLIPKDTHKLFHDSLYIFAYNINKMFDMLNTNFNSLNEDTSYYIDNLQNYIIALRNIQKWVFYKELNYKCFKNGKIN